MKQRKRAISSYCACRGILRQLLPLERRPPFASLSTSSCSPLSQRPLALRCTMLWPAPRITPAQLLLQYVACIHHRVYTYSCLRQDSYPGFMRMMREWRHIKLLKREGRAHQPEGPGPSSAKPGDCAVICPACPHPERNLPDDWAADKDKMWVKKYVHNLHQIYTNLLSSQVALRPLPRNRRKLPIAAKGRKQRRR